MTLEAKERGREKACEMPLLTTRNPGSTEKMVVRDKQSRLLSAAF